MTFLGESAPGAPSAPSKGEILPDGAKDDVV